MQSQTDTVVTPIDEPSAGERLGFPPPPFRARSNGAFALIAVSGGLFLLSLGLLSTFWLDARGRGVTVDLMLAAGLGRPIDAQIAIEGCEAYVIRRIKFHDRGYRCVLRITEGGRPSLRHVDVANPQPLEDVAQAGRVLGQPGLYMPAGVLWDRFRKVGFTLFLGLLQLAVSIWMRGLWKAALRERRTVRRGRLQPVDLLGFRNRPWFSFTDTQGQRHFQRSDLGGNAATLDGAALFGLAVVDGADAVLLDATLQPLELDAEVRERILQQIRQARELTHARPLLVIGDRLKRPYTRIVSDTEAALRGRLDPAATIQCYRDIWPVAWNSEDPELSQRAFALRDRLSARMAPETVWAINDELQDRLSVPGRYRPLHRMTPSASDFPGRAGARPAAE